MPVDTLTTQLTPLDCISKSQAQHDIDEHALAAMSMYDTSQASILSPTPRALNFPNHPMLDITLDGPTPRAFTFPTTVHETMSNGNLHGPPLTPPEPSPSTPSTSPSPFEPEQQLNGLQPQGQGQPQQQQLKAPSIARRSQSMQRVARADTASPAAQISSFNAPDPNPGQPLTLAARRRGSSISSLVLPAHSSHTLNFTHSQPPVQTQQQPPPLPPNPHAHAIQLAGTERRPKRGDEDYIKRPENAFILFRRECCLKRNEAEAAAAQEGDPVQRRQRQADLSKTISQQWRSLSAEERKYWDDLAKQRKKEHEEMYPWYVYQPTRSDRKKKKKDGESTEGGKAKKEKEGKKERRERTKSSSRVRGTGARARNSSTCSSASVASTTSMSSSASTVDSEDFSELDSADSAFYGGYGYSNGTCSSVREVEAADAGDFEMSEPECSQGQTLSLPFSLSMPSLTNGTGSGQGASLAIDTRNALASFSLESGPITTSGYSHSHHGGHGRGHGHSLSAQVPMQTVQSVVPGPLSFVLPQNRRSTSAPGEPTPPNMPADLYQTPPTIKIPQLLDTSNESNNSSAVGSPVVQEPNVGEQQVQMNGQVPREQQREGEFSAMNTFQFPNVQPQPQQMGFGMPGQVPDFSSAGNEIQQNSMFHVYEEPLTAKPRPRALSQITIPNEPPTNSGPLSAPAPPTDAGASSSRMFIPDQFSAAAASQQSNGQLQVPQRAIPQGLPESPEPPAPSEWEDYGLPSWAMSTFTDADEAAFHELQQQQQQQQQQDPEIHAQAQSMFGEIDITMDMGLPPWISFSPMDPIDSMDAMNAMGCGMDAMAGATATDGSGGGGGGENHNVDPYAMHFWQEELLDPSQL